MRHFLLSSSRAALALSLLLASQTVRAEELPSSEAEKPEAALVSQADPSAPASQAAQSEKKEASEVEARTVSDSLEDADVPTLTLPSPEEAAKAAQEKSKGDDKSRIELGKDTVIRNTDDLSFLMPLRRACLPEAKCAIKLQAPVSTHREILPLASEMTALVALELAQREALCIKDESGQWEKVIGEAIPQCSGTVSGPHSVRVRLDPAGDGFLASISFSEGVPGSTSAPSAATSAPSESATPSDSSDSAETPDADAAGDTSGQEESPVGASDESAPKGESSQENIATFAPRPASLRLTTSFEETAEIPFIASRLADGLGNAMGTEAPSLFDLFLKPPEPPTLHVNLKLGNTFSSLDGFDFSAFTLRFDVEVAYYLRPYLMAFLEIGLVIGNASTNADNSQDTEAAGNGETEGDESEGGGDDIGEEQSAPAVKKSSGTFAIVPVNFGLKFNPFYQYSFRPYLGLGLGLSFLSELVGAKSRELTLSFSGILGIAWVPFNHLGFNLETSLNFDELRMGGGSDLLLGFSINFGVMALF